MKQGGFAVYEGLLGSALLANVLDEAVRLYECAEETHEPHSDTEEWRGGSPARRFLSVPGGEAQSAFYQSPEVWAILSQLCGVAVRPTGGGGTFTYYSRPGDHLAIHRDVEQCDLAVITCLHESHPRDVTGKLAVYPGRVSEPLSAIRATPNQGCFPQALLPGQTMLLFGGIIPHQILPVAHEQVRIVSILCYEAIPDSD